ncbi:MAG: hypothetical protein ACREKI_09040, partial [Gemmatimonadota bacterium]
RTIAALTLLMGSDVRELAQFLDRCRTKRHEVTYESVSAVSHAEAGELIKAVRELQSRVRAWLHEEHRDLV